MSVGEKRRAYEEWLQRGITEACEMYKRRRVEVKRKVRSAKRRADELWRRSLSEDFERSKRLFWKVERVRGGEFGGEEK